MQPGNVICLLDFGIVGHLDSRSRANVAALLCAIARRDSERAARALLTVAGPLGEIDFTLLEQDVADFIEAYVGARLGEIPLIEVWSRVLDLISRHQLRLPAHLMLLMKALITIEGVGRSLDQSFRMFEHAQPFVEQLIAEHRSPRNLAARAARSGEQLATTLSTLPEDLLDFVNRARTGRINLQISHPESHELADAVLAAATRFAAAFVSAAALIGLAILMRLDTRDSGWAGAVLVLVIGWIAFMLATRRVTRPHSRSCPPHQ